MKRQSALILLDKIAVPDIDAVVEALSERHPEIEVEPLVGSTKAASSGIGMWLIKCSGKVAVVRYNPERVPEDKLLIALAEWHWSAAKERFNQHEANIHVTTIESDENQLLQARVVSAIVGALISVTPHALAVIYNNKVMQSSALWQTLSTLAFTQAPKYPLQLWIFLNPYRHDCGNLIVTIGLEALIGREIEFEGREDLAEVAQCTATTALFLLDNNTPVQEGDTITFPGQDQYKVHLQKSERFGQRPVYLIRHA